MSGQRWSRIGGGWWELPGAYRALSMGSGVWSLYQRTPGAFIHCWQGFARNHRDAREQFEDGVTS